jgi:hypothetical protein
MVFTEGHKGHKNRIRRAYINDLFVFVTFVAFCRFCLRLLCSAGRRATDPASVRSTSYRSGTDEQYRIQTVTARFRGGSPFGLASEATLHSGDPFRPVLPLRLCGFA